MSNIDDFFFQGNAIVNEPDYGLAPTFVRTAEAFANATYQSVYIIDYYRRNFLYVSPNPLFLCGMTAGQVRGLGYRFYLDHVPADEVMMLLEINRAGFDFAARIPPAERDRYTISYDFHILSGNSRILVNHKLTGLAFMPDGSLWLGLSIVSLSTHTRAGQIRMFCSDKAGYWEYDLATQCWREQAVPVLNETERTILTLSIQGLKITDIAGQAHLAVNSVKSARRRLFEKLRVSNISEAISYATNYKLL